MAVSAALLLQPGMIPATGRKKVNDESDAVMVIFPLDGQGLDHN